MIKNGDVASSYSVTRKGKPEPQKIRLTGQIARRKRQGGEKAARGRLKEVALRGLPAKPKREKVAASMVSFADLVEQFLKDRSFSWKPSTEASNSYTLQTVLIPKFGPMPAVAIRKQDVVQCRLPMV